MLRLFFFYLSTGIALSAVFCDTQAQSDYPSRPIRVVVPTAPSGPPDVTARLVTQELTKRFNRPVVVENRAGAGSVVGTELVAKAPPDGYTLLMSPGTLATNPASYKKLPYDAMRDLAPITQTHFVPNLFVVHPSIPAKSVKEFIAIAKARPGDILYASAGHGTNPHLTIELFANMAHVKLTHVPYKGGLPGVTDLLGGRVVMMMSSAMGLLLPHVRAGKLRALAVTSSERSKAMPQVPTVAETVANFEAVQWAAFMAPAGTPGEIIQRLHKEIVSALHVPEVRDRLASDNIEVVGGTPAELAAYLKSETVKWTKAAKLAGIEPQ